MDEEFMSLEELAYYLVNKHVTFNYRGKEYIVEEIKKWCFSSMILKLRRVKKYKLKELER